jgi:hypothetical protein
MLYVADRLAGVFVFHNASTALEVLGGAINTPDRTLSGNFGADFRVQGIALDTVRNMLFVAVVNPTPLPATTSVMVFDNASGLNGNVAPDRVITLTPTVGPVALFSDAANDRLYVARRTAQSVEQYENASTANGTPAPDRTVLLPSPIDRIRVLVATDRLYALSQFVLYIVPGISTAVGPVAATAVQAPAGALLMSLAVTP